MPKVRRLTTVDGRRYLSIDEAAAWLGVKATVMRNYLYTGHFTTYKFKTLSLVALAELQAWPGRKRGK